MVRLTRIYTRTGDDGSTALGDFSRVAKTDLRVVAYADVDEANSQLGVALAGDGLDPQIRTRLLRVQNELFDVGADLCTPLRADDTAASRLRITQDAITRLEDACDHWNADLGDLRSFVLPGGTPAAAALHVARAVTRRAERAAWAAIEQYGTEPAPAGDEAGTGGVNTLTATYLNRLSDLLFVLARVANRDAGDVLWVPGGDR